MKAHKTELRVRFSETDASGVVFFANYFSWINVAGESLFRDLGYDLWKVRLQEGMIFVATDATASYLSPARHNDELEILTNVRRITESTVGFHMDFVRRADGRILATGEVSLKCVRLGGDNGLRAAEIPGELAESLREYLISAP